MATALIPGNASEWMSTDWTLLPDSVSALELLHPDGFAQRAMVIGSNCPPRLAPRFCESADQLNDVIVLAPSSSECEHAGWLEHAVDVLTEQLASHGVGYVMLPAEHRKRLRRLIRQRGLCIESTWAHRPNHATSRYLVPLQHPAARYAFTSLTPVMTPAHQRLINGALAFPGGTSLVADRLPAVGFVVRRPGARPLLQWLSHLCTDDIENFTAVIKTRPPDRPQIATLLCFDNRQSGPSAVVKMGLTREAVVECMGEAENLSLINSYAHEAGIVVPTSRAVQTPRAFPAVIQSPLSGRPASSLIVTGELTSPELMDAITNWLVAWNSATRSNQAWDRGWLEQTILAPARELTPLLEGGPDYLAWLTARCAAVAGRVAPVVMTHNDLGAENILIDSRGRVGVVDWATAQEQDLPLLDFFFAMANAVATTQSFDAWPQAVTACFARTGAQAAEVAHLQRRLSSAIELPDDLIDICFHACWLRRAMREHLQPSFIHSRPFLEIVRGNMVQPHLWPARPSSFAE